MAKKREKRKLIKTLEWIDKYPGFWRVICEPHGENMNLDEMRVIINSLQRDKLYEMILLTVELHKDEPYIQDMMKSITNKALRKIIKQDGWNGVFPIMMKNLE